MATDKFRVLRKELKNHGVDLPYLAKLCNVSYSTMCATMRGDREWPLEWMYIAMDAMSLPYTNMDRLFPRHGMYAGELEHKTPTPADHLAAAISKYVYDAVKTYERRDGVEDV